MPLRSIALLVILFQTTAFGQELMLAWTKGMPNDGKEFTKYSSEMACFRVKYTRPVVSSWFAGIGIDMMGFRKPDIPERFIYTKTLFGEIGYQLRSIPGLDVDLVLDLGLAKTSYKLQQPSTMIEGSSGYGLWIEPAVIMSLPFSPRLTLKPSIGYATCLDKMGFREPSASMAKRHSELPTTLGPSDSRLGLWTYRIGASFQLRKL